MINIVKLLSILAFKRSEGLEGATFPPCHPLHPFNLLKSSSQVFGDMRRLLQSSDANVPNFKSCWHYIQRKPTHVYEKRCPYAATELWLYRLLNHALHSNSTQWNRRSLPDKGREAHKSVKPQQLKHNPTVTNHIFLISQTV